MTRRFMGYYYLVTVKMMDETESIFLRRSRGVGIKCIHQNHLDGVLRREMRKMEALVVLLISITSLFGFIALGAGVFVLIADRRDPGKLQQGPGS